MPFTVRCWLTFNSILCLPSFCSDYDRTGTFVLPPAGWRAFCTLAGRTGLRGAALLPRCGVTVVTFCVTTARWDGVATAGSAAAGRGRDAFITAFPHRDVVPRGNAPRCRPHCAQRDHGALRLVCCARWFVRR